MWTEARRAKFRKTMKRVYAERKAQKLAAIQNETNTITKTLVDNPLPKSRATVTPPHDEHAWVVKAAPGKPANYSVVIEHPEIGKFCVDKLSIKLARPFSEHLPFRLEIDPCQYILITEEDAKDLTSKFSKIIGALMNQQRATFGFTAITTA